MASLCTYKRDRKRVATMISTSRADFESSVAIGGKELLKLVGILRMPYAVAQKNHPVS